MAFGPLSGIRVFCDASCFGFSGSDRGAATKFVRFSMHQLEIRTITDASNKVYGVRNFFLKENASCFQEILCAPIFNTSGFADFYAILRRYLHAIAAIRRDLYGHFTQLLRSPRECIFPGNMPRALQNPHACSHGTT
ncbi:hypothetical protein [Paraburkholderia bannensis]|uniref:hypothetical protein n=1 Tax=Paraburkholderia bannensis TaxID=765414 RepID=UPI0012EB18AB|nr:hypothetical protein [Paraburkholderia bannensis]